MVVRETLSVTAKVVDQTSAPLKAAGDSFTKTANSVEGANQKAGVSFDSMASAVTAANQAFQLGSAIVGKFTSAINVAIDAANVQIAAERKLNAVLDLSGNLSDERVAGINQFNTAIQQTLGIGDERLLQLESLLLAQGVEADQIQQAIKQTIGLTEITGNLETSVKLVGRALNGETSALTRYGIKADSVAEVQQKLNDLFEVAIAQQDTFATASSRLSANTDDLVESFGLIIVKTGFVIDSTNKSADAVLGLTIAIQAVDKVTRDWAASLDLLDASQDETQSASSLYLDTVTTLADQTVKFLIPGLREASNAFDAAADSGGAAAEAAKKFADAAAEVDGVVAVSAFFGFTTEEAQKLEKTLSKIRNKFQRDQEKAQKKAAATARKIRETELKEAEKIQESMGQIADEAVASDEARLEQLIKANDAEIVAEEALIASIAVLKQQNMDAEREAASEVRELQNEIAVAQVTEAEQVANNIARSFASTFTSVITGTKTVGDAFEALALRIASTFLENAIFTILGALLAPLTGGLSPVVAGLFGFKEGGVIPNAEHGGLVTGGTPGKDSVLINAAPGEVIIPEDLAGAFMGLFGSAANASGAQAGGTVAGGGGGGIVFQIAATVNTTLGDSAAGDRLVTEEILPALQRAKDTGILDQILGL